jgi:hypothetical protein
MQNPHHPGPHQPAQPDLSAWGVNDVTTQLGMQFGSNALHAGQEYMQKNVCIEFEFPKPKYL